MSYILLMLVMLVLLIQTVFWFPLVAYPIREQKKFQENPDTEELASVLLFRLNMVFHYKR